MLGTDRMPLEQQRRELRLVFDLLDSDGSGEIDQKELKAHCSKLGVDTTLQHELTEMIRVADANQNVYILKGRQVEVEMDDFYVGEGKKAQYLGRRPILVRDIHPDPAKDKSHNEPQSAGSKRVLWSIQGEARTQDRGHPDYLGGLRTLMGSINPKDWQKMEGTGTIDFEEFVNLVVPTQASASTKAPGAGVKGTPTDEKEKTGSDEAETAKAAKVAMEEREEVKEEEQEAADRRNIVVHEGRAAFAELLRQCDTMSTLFNSQEDAEEKLLLAAEEEPQSPAQRAVQQVRDNRISTLDLRKLPASMLDAVLMDFCDAITLNTSLLRLHLDGIGLGNVNGGVQVVAQSICANSSITTLTLRDNELRGHAAALTLGVVLQHSFLKEISLAGNHLGPHLALLVQSLPHAEWLETLDLADNGIDDEGASHIARALSDNPHNPPSLKTLHLGQNKIGEKGIHALMEALRVKNGIIQTLHVGSQEVDFLRPASVSVVGHECSMMLNEGSDGARCPRKLCAHICTCILACISTQMSERETCTYRA